MPELPEVEHTRRNLDRWLRRARIESVATKDARIVRPSRPSTFVRALAGRTVEAIERRGKWLKATLDDGRYLFLHLGMTGWFEPSTPAGPALRFERVRLDLVRGAKLFCVVYVDSRRWGRMILSKKEIPTWKALGPDPLDDGVDVDRLEERAHRRRKQSVKELLMDQTVLAGVGNIQAIEALWRSRIHPRSTASALSRTDLEAIVRGLRWTIDRTLADLAKGAAGKPNPFCIYGRKTGEPCPRCRHALERFVLGGRTTIACPGCQVRRRATARSARSARP